MDHEYKDSKTCVVKIKKYDTGSPEEFLRWRLTLNEQMKNHGYSGNYDMVMNLAQAMLTGRGLGAFLSERWAQDIKNKTRKANEQTEYTPQQIYGCAICVNWKSAILTSKVDGEMPLRGSASI
jgi:hypothetical protein